MVTRDRRTALERDVLDGERASECLKLFDDFKQTKSLELWNAVAAGNAPDVEWLSNMAVFSREFCDFLQERENAGKVAAQELREFE